MMRRLIVFVAVLLAVACLAAWGKGLVYYQGRYQAPPAALPGLDTISVASPTAVSKPKLRPTK